MEVDALAQLLTLHAQLRQTRSKKIQLLLLDRTQIGFADTVTCLRQIEGALVVGYDALQQLHSLGQCFFGSKGVLHVANCAQSHARILGHGFLLLDRADRNLGIERAALVDRSDDTAADA